MSKGLVKSTFKIFPGSRHLWMLKINSSVVAMLSKIHLPFIKTDWVLLTNKFMTLLRRFTKILEIIFKDELVRLMDR